MSEVSGTEAMESIQAALRNVLAPLADAPVNEVGIKWTPATGASITVLADEQRSEER